MTTAEERNTAITVMLTVLGVLSIALFLGLLLMQKQQGKDINLGTVLSFRQDDAATDDFDPISWARESASYPPLEEPEPQASELVMLDNEGAIPAVETLPPPSEEIKQPLQPPAKQLSIKQAESTTKQTANKTTVKLVGNQTTVYSESAVTPKKIPVAVFRPVQESIYWVQVFSSVDQSVAEEIREKFSILGFPSAIQIKKIGGTLRYRVRLGAFSRRSEAEYHAAAARKIAGFETSYVTIAAITRQVPTGS